ncbi:MAG: glycosyltransferase family 4 protein [bacterium]|nr:glycosyltransferase family 4 protein [bacterium]
MVVPVVLYVVWQYPVPSERFIVRELRGLATRGVRGAVIVVGPDPEPPAKRLAEAEGWPVVRLRGAWLLALRGALRHPVWMLRAARAAGALVAGGEAGSWHRTARMLLRVPAAFAAAQRSDATLVHAHFATLPASFAMLLGAARRLPWGLSAHARDLYAEPADIVPKVRSAAHVVLCSRAALADLEERVGDGGKLSCIYHGIEGGHWTWTPERPADDPFLVLAVGRFVPKKGLEHLIRACAHARSRGVQVRCELVGEGPLAEELRGVAQELGIAEHVCWTPWLEPHELRARYARAAALAVPSVVASDGDRDNIPNALIEALAMGLPVVASALPAIEEALDGGRSGLLVPPGDSAALAGAITRLAGDARLRRTLAERGRSRFEAEFALEANVARMHALFARSSDP